MWVRIWLSVPPDQESEGGLADRWLCGWKKGSDRAVCLPPSPGLGKKWVLHLV